jgi:hypothetical protein
MDERVRLLELGRDALEPLRHRRPQPVVINLSESMVAADAGWASCGHGSPARPGCPGPANRSAAARREQAWRRRPQPTTPGSGTTGCARRSASRWCAGWTRCRCYGGWVGSAANPARSPRARRASCRIRFMPATHRSSWPPGLVAGRSRWRTTAGRARGRRCCARFRPAPRRCRSTATSTPWGISAMRWTARCWSSSSCCSRSGVGAASRTCCCRRCARSAWTPTRRSHPTAR